MDFTARQLRAFLLVAQHRSFTRASETLLVTPSGLSVLIRELESQIGFRLFDRTTRSVSLTRYGQRLVPLIRRNLRELDSALSQLGQTAHAAGLSISVGAPPLVAANILPQVIREFGELRPEIRVRIFDAHLATIAKAIQAGKLDLGIGIFKNAVDLRRIRMFRFSFVLIRPGANAAPAQTATWSAAGSENLISLPRQGPVQRAIDKQLKNVNRKAEMRIVVNSLDMQIAMVEAGQGAAIIPSFGLPVCRSRNVSASRLVNPTVTMDFHEIRNRGRKLPVAVEEFSNFLRAHIEKWAGRVGVV